MNRISIHVALTTLLAGGVYNAHLLPNAHAMQLDEAAQWRDPTQPQLPLLSKRSGGKTERVLLVDQPVKRTSLQLSAVVSRGDRHFAVINDQVVTIGQHIAGMELLDVQSNSARLRDARGELQLRLYPQGIKRNIRPTARRHAPLP